jgi:hypothetical protein
MIRDWTERFVRRCFAVGGQRDLAQRDDRPAEKWRFKDCANSLKVDLGTEQKANACQSLFWRFHGLFTFNGLETTLLELPKRTRECCRAYIMLVSRYILYESHCWKCTISNFSQILSVKAGDSLARKANDLEPSD